MALGVPNSGPGFKLSLNILGGSRVLSAARFDFHDAQFFQIYARGQDPQRASAPLTGCKMPAIPADSPVRYSAIRPWLVGSECSSIITLARLPLRFPRHLRRALTDQGFHADQRAQAQAPHRPSRGGDCRRERVGYRSRMKRAVRWTCRAASACAPQLMLAAIEAANCS